MKILLIRHGETAGNREKRYVGSRTDEGLTEESRASLSLAYRKKRETLYREFLPVREIFVSPMKRCMETRELLLPEAEFGECAVTVVRGLQECDFGRFEYRNYLELTGDPDYQRFIDSGGMEGFPGGEAVRQFKERCVRTFGELLAKRMQEAEKTGTLVFVVHGGTIMAVLEAFSEPGGDYYSWQAKNGEGYLLEAVADPVRPFGFHLGDIAKVSFL